jgi:hypothetical protein
MFINELHDDYINEGFKWFEIYNVIDWEKGLGYDGTVEFVQADTAELAKQKAKNWDDWNNKVRETTPAKMKKIKINLANKIKELQATLKNL